MNGTGNEQADRTKSGDGLASWYIPGWADGFGDRLLMFDNGGTPSLELLRFRADLMATPGFEAVLRDRVRDLHGFRHPSFAPVRTLERLDDGGGLALVSDHAPGQRLSEIFEQRPRRVLHPRIVTWLLRELTPALAALHAQGPDVAHGALTTDRIVLTPEGRLCIVEHVLGSALRHLKLPPARLWQDFGLVALPPNVPVAQLDARADVIQLAGVALSMLLARPVTLDDLRHRLPKLLDEFSELSTPASAHHVPPLRLWLERALQVSASSYGSAEDAQHDLKELPTDKPSMVLASGGSPTPPVIEPPVPHGQPGGRLPIRAVPRPQPASIETGAEWRSLNLAEMFPAETPVSGSTPRQTPKSPVQPKQRERVDLPGASPPQPPDRQRQNRTTERPFRRRLRWPPNAATVAVALGATAAVEAAIIAAMGTGAFNHPASVSIESSQPGATVLVNGEPVGATPFQLTLDGKVQSVSVSGPALVASSPPDPVSAPVGTKGEEDSSARPRLQDLGGVKIQSSIVLTVFEGERVLGSTNGPVFASAGTHQLELVNSDLGYRTTLPVLFRDGEIRPVRLDPPIGHLNVNAQPWAMVFIDGKAIGETPLANIELTIGQHVVVLRHPRLGERTETVTVRADAVARFSHAFQ